MKNCTKCNEAKPLDGFYVNSRSRSGRQSTCKECARIATARWRADNPEAHRAYTVQWNRDNPERHRAAAAQWAKDNPERAKANAAKWRADHSEEVKAAKTKWANDHPEKVKTSLTKWNEAHPEKRRAIKARWSRDNPEACRASNHKRRAAKRSHQGSNYTASDVAALLVDQHDLCAYCGMALNGKYHIDHVVPLARGGGNGPDNIALACAPCNLSKADKSLLMWAMFLGWRL